MAAIATTYPILAQNFGSICMGAYPYDLGWHCHATLRGYRNQARRWPDAKIVLLTGRKLPSGEQGGRVEILCRDLLAALAEKKDFVAAQIVGEAT